MSYNQFSQAFVQQNFGRTQSSGFGMRNTQQNQFGQQSFNQPRISVNDQFLSSQNGGLMQQRSQTELRAGLGNAFRQNIRAYTPDNMQFNQFNSSAQSGKQIYQPGMQTTGYTQPFQVDGNRQLSTPQHIMDYTSPEQSGVFKFGQALGMNIQQSNGFDFRTTNMNRTQNIMGSSQFQMQDHFNQAQFFGAQMSREVNVESVRNNMATLIKETGHRTANSFLREFDTYEGRNFETWELMSIFRLSSQQVRALLKQTDPEFNQKCVLKNLCQELKMAQVQVDLQGYIGTSSEYQERFNRSALQSEFKQLARFILGSEFNPSGSNSYREAFIHIKKLGKPGQQDLEVASLKDFLEKKCNKILNPVQQSRFVEYLQFSRGSQLIKDVQFVQAMRQILPDQKNWDLSELMEYLKGVEPAQEKDKQQQESQDPLNPLIEKIRLHLYNKALYYEIDSKFKNQLKLKLKLAVKEPDLGDQTVAPITELTNFLDSLQQDLKLTQKEREQLIARYFVIPQNQPQLEKPPNPPPTVAVNQSNQQNLSVPSNEALPKIASQQNLAPQSQSKELSHVPSGDSLARDSLGDSKMNLPPVFNNTKAPLTNQQEVMEEEIYEDDDDFDSSRAPADQKNEADRFEGGSKEAIQKWFSLQKFKADMKPTKDMLDKKLTYSRPFKFEVLQSIKGWVALTGGSVIELFKLQDKKGTLYSAKRQLKQVLQKIMSPKIVSELHLNSVLEFFARVNDQGHICIEYMQFYQFFYQYANLLAIQETDQRYVYLKELHDLTNQNENFNASSKQDQKEKKSFGKLLGLTEFQKKLKDLPIDVEIGVLFQVYQKIKSRISTMRRGIDMQQFKYEKEIRELLKVHDNKFNLIYFQELMGFKKEEEPQFAATNAMRQLCSSLQIGGISIETMRHVLGKETNIQRFLNDLFILLQSHGVYDGPSETNQQITDTIQGLALSMSSGSQINAQKFVGKIEFEMHKMITLEHFYIKLKAQMRANNIDLVEVFVRFGADRQQREFSRDNLLQMLRQLNLIGEEDNGELQYFIDEYDSEDNRIISIKQFEDDFEEFVGSPDSYMEQISQKVLSMIMMVSSQYHQSDLVATINTAFESQPSNKIKTTWMQNYDFSRWFQVAIIESQYQSFDYDLIELFLQYTNACDNSQRKMINVPNLLKKIAELHLEARTDNLRRQLANLSVKILQNRIVDELHKRNQKPDQYFQGRLVSYFEFEKMITSGPFNLQTLELNSTLQEISELYKRGNSDIAIDEFIYELNQIYDLVGRKTVLFKQMQNSMEEKGQDIVIILKMIKGQLSSSTHMSLQEFIALINLAGIQDIDEQTIIIPIFEKFELDSHGEVSTEYLIQEFESITKSKQKKTVTFQNAGRSLLSTAGGRTLEPTNKPIVARRNYKTVEQCLHAIARDIEERQLSDFGSFLKGYDFTHTDNIEPNNFFKVLLEIFKEQIIGKGDILDLISYFDPRQIGKINIREVADEINRLIYNPEHKVVLVSRLDEVIEDKILEEIEDETQRRKIDEPTYFANIVLDLFCGLYVRKQTLISEWLGMFSRQEEGYMNLQEFTASLDKLDVQATKLQKKAVFDYFVSIDKFVEREAEIKKIGFVPTSLIIETISSNRSSTSIFDFVQQIVTKICLYLHKTKTPIIDCCKKFELTEGSEEISYVDFTHGLLQQELKLENDITRNMIEVLQIYFNPDRSQTFSIQPFMNMVKQIAFDEGLRIYQTQDEVDFDDRDQLSNADITQTVNKRIPPKAEPSFEIRSAKNTYFNGEKFSVQLGDPQSYKLNDDIILATRQQGVSVEKHFQKFGRFSTQDGLRHLDLRDFREALSALKVQWADKTETTASLYHQIEEIFSTQTLTLDMIGQSVYFNSNVNLVKEEALILEVVHRELYANKMLNNVEEVLNFHNFTKDGCQSQDDFKNMLLNHLSLKNKVSEQNIGLLTQRYRVNHKDNKQLVFAFKFVQDLAYQHLNIGVLDQWASKIIEQMVKQLQIKLVIDANRQALNDGDTLNELKQFFIRNCQQSRDEIFYEDLLRSFAYLKIIDETDQMSKLQVDNFFKICSLPQTADIRTFKSNSVNAESIDLPFSIKLSHFLNSVQVLGRKPLSCLYQDVFLQVYFSSKKRGISINGSNLTNLFITDDISSSGLVPLNIFIDRLREKIIDARQNITDQDLQFLSTKYVVSNRGQPFCIRYTHFLDDYSEADQNQVSGKLSLIFNPNDAAKERELQIRLQSVEDVQKKQLKTIDQIPENTRPFFAKMSKYLTAKNLDEIFCMEMINRDVTREGYLSSVSIKEALKKIGIPISQNQLQQLTSVLQVDMLGNFSYLEIISILFGIRYMRRIQNENGLWSEEEKKNNRQVVDISKLKLSQSLIDQLELKLIQIKNLAQGMSKSTNLIRDQDVFTLLKKSEIVFDSQDLETIQTYLRETRDQTTNQISLQVMLKHFKVGEETSALLYQIQQQLANIDLNSLTSQPQITFIDFRGMLARQNINLSNTGNTLERLFKQISQQKQEVSRATLLRILQPKHGQAQNQQIPGAPKQINELFSALIDKKVDLQVALNGYVSNNRVPRQKFEQILTKNSIKFSKLAIDFFTGTHGDLNLQKLLAYYEQAKQNYQQILNEMSEDAVEQNFKTKLGELPEDIKIILDRFTILLEKRRQDTMTLFKELDSNKNGLIEITEFETYCTKEGLIQGLPKQSIDRLFKYLDSTGDGQVSVNELCMLIKGLKSTRDERLATAFTKEFVEELIQEIELLFDRFDSDKNRWLTAKELVIIFKNDGPSNSLSLEQAKQVIDEIDKDSNGRISKEEFVNYILQRQKLALLEMDDQLQDLREIFAALVNVKSGFGVEQHLTTTTFKNFLKNAGLENINDYEADNLFNQIDTNQSSTIDIDEIMKFVTSNDNIVGSTGTTLLKLRKKRAKLNQIDMFEFLNLLPPYLQPSFSQRYIESQKEGRLSNALIPSFDFTQFKFRDLKKVQERSNMGVKEFIAQQKPKFAFELTITEIKGVPNLAKQLVLDESQNHFEIRYFLFDATRQVFTSAVLISHAKVAAQKQSQKGFVPSYAWCVEDPLKTICLRASENWQLVIELVAFDQHDKSRQITVGWTSCPLTTKPGKTKLPLRGGSPFISQPPEIITSENENKVTSGISKFFNLNKASVVERHVLVEIQPFFKLDEKTQADISTMPENTLLFKSLLSFVSNFRIYCSEKLQKYETQMEQPRSDLVISQFAKLYDSPDVSAAIAEIWPRLIQADSGKDKTATVKTVIQRLYSLINTKEFGFDHLYPTRSTTAQKLQKRMEDLKTCLLQEKSASPPQPQKQINTIIFNEDYQPFSMNELSLSLV